MVDDASARPGSSPKRLSWAAAAKPLTPMPSRRTPTRTSTSRSRPSPAAVMVSTASVAPPSLRAMVRVENYEKRTFTALANSPARVRRAATAAASRTRIASS